VFYANPNVPAAKFVKSELVNNKTIFPSADDIAKMVPPDSVSNETRRLRTRLFTNFKAGK
jgi:putrescine transport system substrate-binding protein